MALVEPKKGGPYHKQVREEKIEKVYDLYFEKGMSAVKIAEELNVNRNTVNEYIKYWYTQLGKELENYDMGSWVVKQIKRLELQRNRLLDKIENQNQFRDILDLEKLIFEIDNKISQIILKIIPYNKNKSQLKYNLDNIDEDKIKEIVRILVYAQDKVFDRFLYAENTILSNIIKITKCDLEDAKTMVNKMMELGLDLYKVPPADFITVDRYNVLSFAEVRGYVSKKELSQIEEELEEKEKKEEEECKRAYQEGRRSVQERRSKFFEKYGSDLSKWSEDVQDEYFNPHFYSND